MMIAIIIISVLIIASLIGLFAAYYKVFYCPHKDMSEYGAPLIISNKKYREDIQKNTRILAERPFEGVSTRAYDGISLAARYYYCSDTAPLCICFHGYRGSAVRDFSVMGRYLRDAGNNVILVDHRAHWKSGGHTITYGIRERRDVLSWINYANERFGSDKPIYLFGISMGAGTVLMASGLELPDNVKGICADCPFNSPKDIINHVSRKIGLNPSWTWPVTRLAALVYGRLNINETTAADEVKKATKPILIIHGEADDFVPMYMSEQVRDARPDLVEYHTFPGAGHGLSYYADPERYLRIVDGFMQAHR